MKDIKIINKSDVVGYAEIGSAVDCVLEAIYRQAGGEIKACQTLTLVDDEKSGKKLKCNLVITKTCINMTFVGK